MSEGKIVYGKFRTMSEKEIILTLLDVITEMAEVAELLLVAVDPKKMTKTNFQNIRAKLDQVNRVGREVVASLPRI